MNSWHPHTPPHPSFFPRFRRSLIFLDFSIAFLLSLIFHRSFSIAGPVAPVAVNPLIVGPAAPSVRTVKLPSLSPHTTRTRITVPGHTAPFSLTPALNPEGFVLSPPIVRACLPVVQISSSTLPRCARSAQSRVIRIRCRVGGRRGSSPCWHTLTTDAAAVSLPRRHHAPTLPQARAPYSIHVHTCARHAAVLACVFSAVHNAVLTAALTAALLPLRDHSEALRYSLSKSLSDDSTTTTRSSRE